MYLPEMIYGILHSMTAPAKPAKPLRPLNWTELKELVQSLAAEVEGRFVDRIYVPTNAARAETAEGFLRSEWAFRLSARGKPERELVFSLRPQAPWILVAPEKTLKPAANATQSPFSLALQARLQGAKLLGISTLPQERGVILRFSGTGETDLVLALMLIPALPEAYLFEAPANAFDAGIGLPANTDTTSPLPADKTFALLARSRPNRELSWQMPSPTETRASMEITEPSVHHWEDYFRRHEAAILDTALHDRHDQIERHLKAQIKNLKNRRGQAETQADVSSNEPDWKLFGDLLKTEWAMQTVSDTPWSKRLEGGKLAVETETGKVLLPIDPEFLGDRFAGGFDAKSQLERYFSRARRGKARGVEASERHALLTESIDTAEAQLKQLKLEWSSIRVLENKLGLRAAASAPGASEKFGAKSKVPKKNTAAAQWSGKLLTTKEGLIIRAGRNKTENLELTFKIARGNDLWLHLKGKPGSHVLITLPPGKSASLETLLDAAHLCIHYSGGADWGKAEVDYTARKNVKRIKDSDEASYTQNKTLMVAIDRERIRRLLAT